VARFNSQGKSGKLGFKVGIVESVAKEMNI